MSGTAGTLSAGALYAGRVIGHRGACAKAPENTLSSLRRAARDGAAVVEVDVKLTAEGRPVLFHDDRLDRTTDGHGAVASATLDMLGALDAGAWFAPEFAGEPIPTLEEALEVILGLGLGVNLEIKPCPGREAETARAVAGIAAALWPADRPPPLLSSFSRESLAVARDTAPALPRALIADRLPGDWKEAALILGLKAVHLGPAASREEIVTAVSGGAAVAVWTINDATRAAALFRHGASAVFCDDPGRMIRALDRQ
ncbi:glycerophosphodiester phosphodiesterase family protein [Novispirillum sp. DQ9]|uniref:glycerophosphodiester phosphodiesterase family protein n=1 Tax=Novispirillum sp. DQ9 TaxID=3398612 RepID=UPI003C7D5743